MVENIDREMARVIADARRTRDAIAEARRRGRVDTGVTVEFDAAGNVVNPDRFHPLIKVRKNRPIQP